MHELILEQATYFYVKPVKKDYYIHSTTNFPLNPGYSNFLRKIELVFDESFYLQFQLSTELIKKGLINQSMYVENNRIVINLVNLRNIPYLVTKDSIIGHFCFLQKHTMDVFIIHKQETNTQTSY